MCSEALVVGVQHVQGLSRQDQVVVEVERPEAAASGHKPAQSTQTQRREDPSESEFNE